MTYATLKIARAQLIAFTPALARRHNFVQLPSGRWCLVLGVPSPACKHIRGRIYRLEASL